MRTALLRLCFVMATSLASASAVTVTFDDLPLPPDSAENGTGLSPYATGTVFGQVENQNRFTSAGVDFENRYIPSFATWSRWAYSNRNDTATADFSNDLSAFTSSGPDGNFGVNYDQINRIALGAGMHVPMSVAIANITYPALTMRDGDGFSKKFGGVSGNDPDFFLLEIIGLDSTNATTGTVPVYLADYRFADNSMDYILSDWLTVDLSPLGSGVETLEFRMSSSDNGAFGVNTPTYFAMDNLVAVPEPGAAFLVLGALVFALGRRSRMGLLALLAAGTAQAGSFAPAAGVSGSTAVAVDDSRITGWATGVADLTRGPVDIAFPDGEVPTNGEETNVIGVPSEYVAEVLSLGDGGSVTLTFAAPLFDGPGADFAVFENSFDGEFLELGFVEVSSDGVNFTRFPSSSITQVTTQVGPFTRLDPTNVHNLAGKYKFGYGTPFDLAELANSPGLDIQGISHVRVVDVIGAIGSNGSLDSQGRKINDPYPTDFSSGGFDLSGIAVLGPAMTTYAEWASERGAGAASGDDDKDGRPNLLEYALGGNPASPDTGGGIVLGANPGQFCFHRVPWAGDLQYVFEVSVDLKTWTSVAQGGGGNAVSGSAGFTVSESAAAGGLKKATVSGPVSTIYGRLRVSR